MENKQLYVVGIVVILVAASIGVFFIMSGDDEGAGSFTDAAGNEINIPDNIESITAASPSIVDILCYMGYAEKIIAVSTSCSHPDLPGGLTTVGSYSNPNTDGISAADATVTFIDGSGNNGKAAYNTLRDSGMFVIMMYGSNDTFEGIFKNVEIVGKVMKNSSYEGIISDLKKEIAYLDAATAGSLHKSIMITTGLGSSLTTDASGNFVNLDTFNGSGVYAAGMDSAICGMANAVSKMTSPASGSGWPQLDTDFISTSTGSVDIIIVLWTNKPALPTEAAINELVTKMKGMSHWGNCGAVKAGNIVFVGGDAGSDLSRVTPYTVYRGLPALSLYINPDAYSKTDGGAALKLSDLPKCIDTNLSTLIGYTNNKPAVA